MEDVYCYLDGAAAHNEDRKDDADARRLLRNLLDVYRTADMTVVRLKIKELHEYLVPTTFALDQNYPNPFNPTTTIRFALPSDGVASLKVYDLLGREVASLVEGFRTAGAYEVQLNVSSLASGVCVYG
jgi:hypothetical protein